MKRVILFILILAILSFANDALVDNSCPNPISWLYTGVNVNNSLWNLELGAGMPELTALYMPIGYSYI